jgi:hypothetical protein
MLNAWLRGRSQPHESRALAAFAAIAQKSEHGKKPYVIDISEESEKDRVRRCAIAP